MNIAAISSYSVRPNFTASQKGEYENPINRKAEKRLAIWGNIGFSTIVGGTAALLGTFLIGKGSPHRGLKLGGIGLGAGLITMALTLPAKIYDTKVRAFTREKEMDVFSREKDLKSNMMEEINNEVKDEDVDLDQKINHYATVQMANNGNGVMVKGV